MSVSCFVLELQQVLFLRTEPQQEPPETSTMESFAKLANR